MTTTELRAFTTFFVPGTPAPAGSKNAIPIFNRHTGQYVRAANGRPVVAVVDAAKKSRPWKTLISAMAADVWNQPPLDEPIELALTFTMPRPKGHFGSRKGEPVLKESAPTWHTSAPDTTKLVRAVEDALNGVVWKDDSRVVKQSAEKRYGDRPGVLIEIRRIA